MLDHIVSETLTPLPKFIERCQVISLGSGSPPKDITIQLPDADGAQIPVRWNGHPPLVVNDYVSIRSMTQDPVKYEVLGTSSSTAYPSGKALVSSNDTTLDYLLNKLSAGAGITLTELNDGADEDVEIAVAVTGKNLLYHSLTYDIWPGGYSFAAIADDTYAAGLWNVVHNAPSTNPDVVGTAIASGDQVEVIFRATWKDAAGARMGFVHFLQAGDTYPLRGETVSISFDARMSSGANMDNLRCALISWTGTANSITSDVVATWGAKPTLATNWAYVGSSADSNITITSSWARYTVDGISVPTGANNLGVFIWAAENYTSVSEYVDIGRVQLEIGANATSFQPQSKQVEALRVSRFVEYFSFGDGNTAIGFGIASSTTAALFYFKYFRKRGTPTLTLSAASTWFITTTAASFTITGISALGIFEDRCSLNCTGATGLTAGNVYMIVRHSSAAATVLVDARL